MKVLTIDIHFKLPDDFEGGLTEALEEYVKYRKENNLPAMPDPEGEVKTNISHDEYTSNRWKTFLEAIKEGKKVYGMFDVSKLVDDKWEDIKGN